MSGSGVEHYYLHVYPNFYIDYIQHTPTWNWGGALHMHNTGEFMLVERGRSHIYIGNESFHAEGSYLIYYPPHTLHRQINNSEYPFDRYCFSFSETYFESPVEVPGKGYVRLLSEEELDYLRFPVQGLHRYFASVKVGLTPLMKSRRELLFRLFLTELSHVTRERLESPRPNGQYIDSILTYLDRHINTSTTLDELAARFHVSRVKLTRDFRQEMGMSVGEYTATIRLNYAKQFLLAGASVTSVARACGYTDDANFVRFFKKNTGLSPVQFRQNRYLQSISEEKV